MKRIGRVSLYILLGSFILIQFLRTEKNVSDEVSPFDFLEVNATTAIQIIPITPGMPI